MSMGAWASFLKPNPSEKGLWKRLQIEIVSLAEIACNNSNVSGRRPSIAYVLFLTDQLGLSPKPETLMGSRGEMA